VGEKGGGGGKGGVMTQSLYAHMNKGNKKEKKKMLHTNIKGKQITSFSFLWLNLFLSVLFFLLIL
jgi:hypothetical protein